MMDPAGQRGTKPREGGKTMVIDKGLGLASFHDLLETSHDYIDIIKLGFGTAALYPRHLLEQKIAMAKEKNIVIYPGGTFQEIAVFRDLSHQYVERVAELGFNGIEISDGTIEMSPAIRKQMIRMGKSAGLRVVTEYGKKCWGSRLRIDDLVETALSDAECGAELFIVEGRESGSGVGIYDELGHCRDEEILEVVRRLGGSEWLMWEAPHKDQQVHLIQLLGRNTHFGNIAPQDVYSLEALRRGLRMDTFHFELALADQVL
uniref:phosphosulfolactate synthase n=1 Tax=Gorillibacterium massiliense TaxID=1280390 RepID=UPI0005933D72